MNNTDENKHHHLTMIQNVITRMANNSFLLKSWGIVIISALFALAAEKNLSYFAALALVPVIAFWILDSYFLWQERQYRELYKDVATRENNNIDYSLNASGYTCESCSWGKAFWSKTLMIFYGLLFIMVTALFCLDMNCLP